MLRYFMDHCGGTITRGYEIITKQDGTFELKTWGFSDLSDFAAFCEGGSVPSYELDVRKHTRSAALDSPNHKNGSHQANGLLAKAQEIS